MQWPLRRCLKTKYNTLSVSIDLLTPETATQGYQSAQRLLPQWPTLVARIFTCWISRPEYEYVELIQVHVNRYSNTDCNHMPRCLTLLNDYTVVFWTQTSLQNSKCTLYTYPYTILNGSSINRTYLLIYWRYLYGEIHNTTSEIRSWITCIRKKLFWQTLVNTYN